MENKSWTKVLVGIILLYVLFSVSKVLYQNFKVNKEVDQLKVEIEELRIANKEYADKLLYYQSPSYREKIARERLGLQKEGEEVVVILPEERPKDSDNKTEDKRPNYQKWWDFFFKQG